MASVEQEAMERSAATIQALHTVYNALEELPDNTARMRVLMAAQALLGLQWEDLQQMSAHARAAVMLRYPDKPIAITTTEPKK